MSTPGPRGGDFWARRKAAVAAEARAEVEAERAAEKALRDAALEETPDAEILAELDLPDPDTLSEGDDFTAYLKDAVPERIRRRALRRLWRTNPVLANLDGLIDYGGDYTDKATVIPNLATTYQVGKGMLAHLLALEEKKKAEAEAAEAADEIEDDLDLAPEDDAEEDAAEELVAAAPAPVAATVTDDDEPGTAPARRRMRFAFET